MSIVKFEFDKEKDLRNIWNTANTTTHYGHDFKSKVSKNLIEICENKKYEECREELLKTMSSLYKNLLLKIAIKTLNKAWDGIEKDYFARLEKITKQKLSIKKVKAYLTTISRCPYNPDSKETFFFCNFFWSLSSQMQTAGHELMHIHLHNSPWWDKVEIEIGKEKTHDLKESMTQLLNLEFRDLWIVEDRGYDAHAELRKYISSEWKRKKNFNLLTENCIKWIKKNGVK